MLTRYFTDPPTLARFRSEIAGPQLDDFITWLERRGYHRSTIRRHIREAVNFTFWALAQRLTLHDLDRATLERFGRQLARRNALRAPSGNYTYRYQSARLFVRFLEAIGIIPPCALQVTAPLPALFVEFTDWMRTQRGYARRHP